MRKLILGTDERGVSEVIGALLLVLIAVVVFTIIYMYVFPLPFPPAEPNAKLKGYVDDTGQILIKHVGGESLSSYEIYADGALVYENDDDPWDLGEIRCPPIEGPLILEEDELIDL